MREAAHAKSLQALLLASCLVASTSASGEELRREQVTLSAEAHARAKAPSPRVEDWKGDVLSLRVMDPGTLVVEAGDEVVAAGELLWGEGTRLRVEPRRGYPPAPLPRLVSPEPGREEVEVDVPEGVGAGGVLTLTYDWGHKDTPALERTWRLPPMEDIPPEWLEDELVETEQEGTPEDEADSALAFLSPQQAPLPVQVDPERPELLWVPAYASREELASRLFGEAAAVGAFDFEPRPAPPNAEGEPRQCVRVRHPPALRPELLAQVRGALDERLKADSTWSRAQLSAESLDRPGAEALVERGLRWSQRSEIPDGSGQSYFDSYLQTLAPWREAKPRGLLGDTLAQDWHFLGESSEPLQKAIALRSQRWTTSYTVTDGSPVLSPGDVVGRFYFPDGSSVQVYLQELLTEERSQERAEIRLRNLPLRGPRVIIPGEDERWRGYSADFRLAAGAPEPLEYPAGDFFWYYPGTVFIRPDDWRLGVGSGTGELAALRRAILTAALARATPDAPEPLHGLDYDVLSLLTREERLGIFDTVLNSSALTSDALEEDAAQLLGRLVLSMPAEEFPTLERRLTSGEALDKLLGSNAPHKVLLGQAFTQKALASFPLVLGSLDDLPTFELGHEGGTAYLVNVSSGLVPTKLVATEAWDVKKGVSLEAEPALPQEAPGASRRMALYFEPVKHDFQARYGSSTEAGTRSRAFHPLEWVRVEVHGPQPRTQLMTAMELALHASLPDKALIWAAVIRIIEMRTFYRALYALTKAPLLPVVPATAAEGGALAAAQRTAVRQFVGRTALLTTLAVVDTYRAELSRTAEGRYFLAVHDLALLALAARDVSKLINSGIWRELAYRGGLLLSQSGARASAGLRESVESIQALAKTLERMLAEGKALATPDGLRFPFPGGAEAFKQTFFAIRGEIAAARALGGIRGAGLAAQEAEKTLEALKLLAAESQEMARAYGAVARRAAALPADKAQAYLAAVDKLRASTRGAVKPALAELLRYSGARSLKDPLAFLKEADWLVSHPELEAEAVATLARKACRNKVDLSWLRSTSLTLKDLNAMGRNKMTPWKDFQRAAAEPGNLKLQRRVREQLRGLATEMLTEDNARKLFPGFQLTGRQVKMGGGHIIDEVLTAMMGPKLQHGVEVKGWNENRWRKALDTWLAREGGARLNEQQEALVRQLQRLLDQLTDAAKAPRGPPFLVSTDKLSGPTKAKLLRFLNDNARGTPLIQIEEAKILETTKQWRGALRLPEDLSGGAP
ncbi:hypothetical protein [Archangium lansingense]|uniref:Lipoprotein n=1 Tax=Archangium lansingense TaxID=2995310 RepID=A0ABT4AQ09_9BACT|nr:hypothetical protein [Archangium lansinium]MCY1083791.1 hypothetical protein [Archangium lansinium]